MDPVSGIRRNICGPIPVIQPDMAIDELSKTRSGGLFYSQHEIAVVRQLPGPLAVGCGLNMRGAAQERIFAAEAAGEV